MNNGDSGIDKTQPIGAIIERRGNTDRRAITPNHVVGYRIEVYAIHNEKEKALHMRNYNAEKIYEQITGPTLDVSEVIAVVNGLVRNYPIE